MSSSHITDALVTTGELSELFADTSAIQAMLDVEAALARAESTLGIVPPPAAMAITKAARRQGVRRCRIGSRGEGRRYDCDPARQGAHRTGSCHRSCRRGLRALGRDQPGHRRYRTRDPHRSGGRSDRARSRGTRHIAPCALGSSQRRCDDRTHGAAAGGADDVRPEGRRMVCGRTAWLDPRGHETTRSRRAAVWRGGGDVGCPRGQRRSGRRTLGA